MSDNEQNEPEEERRGSGDCLTASAKLLAFVVASAWLVVRGLMWVAG